MSTGSGGGTKTIPSATGNFALDSAAQTLSQKTVSDTLLMKRIRATQGTALVPGDFSVSSGSFGTTASFSSVSGTDQAWTVSIASAGTGQTGNPTARLTFHDGTWTNSPIVVCNRAENGAPNGTIISTATTTTVDMTFAGTPVAATTYI